MNEHEPDDVTAGHRVYTSRFLRVYDLVVLGWFSRTAWRCRAAELTGHYDAEVSANHLDVGVGTGFFLDRCTFPTPRPRLSLMDLNPACLEAASRRVSRFQPDTHVANVLEPIGPQVGDVAAFDSIAMTYLLHCLPGDMTAKAAVFEHLLALANPGATVFGATLLAGGVNRNWYAAPGDGLQQPARDLLKRWRRSRRARGRAARTPRRRVRPDRRLRRPLRRHGPSLLK